MTIPEHNEIKNVLLYGYPSWSETEIEPICPWCGMIAQNFYLNKGKIIGCDKCLDEVNAEEYIYDRTED